MKLELKRKWPFVFREQLKSIVANLAQSFWGKTASLKPKNIKTYYEYFENNGSVQRAIIDLAEMACGQGFYLTVDKDKEAKKLCDEFNQTHNADSLFPNIAKNMLIAGFLPVETQLNKLPTKCALKIVHPKTVANIILDPVTAQLKEVHQKGRITSLRPIKLDAKNLAWYVYNQIGNDLRGTSIIKGIVDVLGYQGNAIENMDKILARHASPLGIWKSKRAIDAIQKAVTGAEAGEDIFLGNLSDEEIKDLVQFIQLDPRARFWEYNEYFDRKIYESLGAPSLGYWRNATEASANKLDDVVLRNVYALQRNVKRVAEASWYGPLCKLNNCKEVPKLEWGMERTGVEDLNISDFLVKGLEVGYITLPQYLKLLNQMGLRIEEETEKPSGAAKPPEEIPTDEETKEMFRKILEHLKKKDGN